MDVISLLLLILMMWLMLPVFVIQAVECRNREAWLCYGMDLVVMTFAVAQLVG